MADPLLTVPTVAIAPPPRCYYRGELAVGPPCGELASWARPGRDWFTIAYFCDEHHATGDKPIEPEHVIRRVRVLCEVLYAAVATNAPMAQVEAVARLEQAVRVSGGLVDVHLVHSLMVKSPAPPGAGRILAGQGRRE